MDANMDRANDELLIFFNDIDLKMTECLNVMRMKFKNNASFNEQFKSHFFESINKRIKKTYTQFENFLKWQEDIIKQKNLMRRNQILTIDVDTIDLLDSEVTIDVDEIEILDSDGDNDENENTTQNISPQIDTPNAEPIAKEVLPNEKKRFRCRNCDYSTDIRAELTQHKSSHSDTRRPFVCDICSSSFSKVPDLFEHNKAHASLFKFICSRCNYGFDQQDIKDQHEQVCKTRDY